MSEKPNESVYIVTENDSQDHAVNTQPRPIQKNSSIDQKLKKESSGNFLIDH